MNSRHSSNGFSMNSLTGSPEVTDQNGDSPTKIVSADEFMNVIQVGPRAFVESLVEKSPTLINMRDNAGHTCMHWAAKRGQVDILQCLYDKGALINQSTTATPNMLPIHWAAAEGHVEAVEFFLGKNQDINVQDGNGCSPAVVAVQYNQLRTVVYLAKHGADLTLADVSGDHCLHWAAYKGYDELLHLILYFLPNELNAKDKFGQTPLHLSAMKGHSQCCIALIKVYKADFSQQDKTGLTALAHTITKGNYRTEWEIRGLTATSVWAKARDIIVRRFREKRLVIALLFGMNQKEQSAWMWRGTFLSNFFASIMTFYYALHDKMGDLYVLHFVNTTLQVMWWICFLNCRRDSGYVEDKPPADINYDSPMPKNSRKKDNIYPESPTSEVSRPLTEEYQASNSYGYRSYEEALTVIGRGQKISDDVKVCHTCRVVRPLRSKHCRILNRCVQRFDHFCPFVDGSLGRDNYRFFLGLLMMHPIAYAGYVIATIYFFFRASISIWYWFFLAYSLGMCFMLTGLINYHLYISLKNLTTNEDMGKRKYKYLYDEKGEFNNPFNVGSPWGNLMEVIIPDTKSYFNRQEVLQSRQQQRRR